MSKYVCKECGSENVRRKYWGDVNGDCTIEATDDYWCCDCEDYTEPVAKEEFNRQKRESNEH